MKDLPWSWPLGWLCRLMAGRCLGSLEMKDMDYVPPGLRPLGRESLKGRAESEAKTSVVRMSRLLAGGETVGGTHGFVPYSAAVGFLPYSFHPLCCLER